MKLGLGIGVTYPRNNKPTLVQSAIDVIRRLNGTALFIPDDYGWQTGPERITTVNSGGGSFSGTDFVEDLTNTYHGASFVNSTTLKAQFKFRAKAGTESWVWVRFEGYAGGNAWFNLSAGSVGTVESAVTASMTDVGDGYYECTLTNKNALPAGNCTLFAVTSNGSTATYTGTGSVAFQLTSYSVKEITSAAVFVDSTGIQPVTAIGDLVGLLTDRSYGAGNLGVDRVSNGNNETTLFTIQGGIVSSDTVARASAPGGGFAASNTSTTSASSAHRFYGVSPMITGKTYQLTGRFYVPTGGISTFKIYDNVDGSWFGVSSSAKDQWVQFSVIRTAKATNWDLGIGDNVPSVVTSGQIAFWIDDLAIREVLGNHATQPTTTSKPVATRVPKRLGPELSDYVSGFTSTTGISGVGATVAVSANELVITSTSADGSDRGEIPISGLAVGRSYSATIVARRGAQGTGQQIQQWTVGTIPTTVISSTTSTAYPVAFVATATSGVARVYSQAVSGAIGDSAIVTSISIREVLEWTNALSFDGSNDFLQTGITTGNEGWICAGVTFGGAAANNETVFSSGAGSAPQKGVWLLRNGSSTALRMGVGNGTTLAMTTVSSLPLLNMPRVVEGGWDASTVFAGVDGTTTSTAKTGDVTAPGTALMGAFLGGILPLQGPMTAIIYTPVLPSAADRALIREWVGSLQGQTL